MKLWFAARDVFLPHARNNYRPHALGKKSLATYAGIMLAAKVLVLFLSADLALPRAAASELNSASILALTNYSRDIFGLEPLQLNVKLNSAAQQKAADMLTYQYFAHTSPDGLEPWDFIKAQGYNYVIAGENLAINFTSAEGAEKAWMNSPNHKANILNKDFKDVGIGMVNGLFKGVSSTIVVQIFGTSIDQPFTPLPNYSRVLPEKPESENIIVPLPAKITLSAPILDSPKFRLTNQSKYLISGIAPSANIVYLLVNHQPQLKLEVIQGHFSGILELVEGDNLINAISFDNQLQASVISNSITIQLDTLAPAISGAAVKPVVENSRTYYLVEVQAQSDAAKLVANFNTEHLLLQPGTEQNTWQGKFAVDPQISLSGRMVVNIYDLAGNVQSIPLVSFSSNIAAQSAPQDYQSGVFFGTQFHYDQINAIFIYFALFLLAAMIFAIAVKRHIQQIGTITQTSAMVMLAMIFWVT